MDEQDRQLISRLSNLVEAVTVTLRLRGSGSNVEQGQEAAAAPETSNNVKDTLKELYPSIDHDRSQSQQGMEIGLGLGLPPASTRFDPRRSYGRPKAKKSNRKAQGRSTGSSSITLTKARSYTSNQQSQRETDSEGFFFINDPRCEKVPRRCEREYCYNKELLACTVHFRASMIPCEIKERIQSSLERFNGFCPAFQFLKAVGDKLVCLNINEWDLKVRKHQTGQGPLYVRTLKKVNLNNFSKTNAANLLSQSESSSDDDYSNSSPVNNSSLTPMALNNTRVQKRPRLGSPYSTSTSLALVSCPSNAQENAISMSGTAKESYDE